MLHIHVVIYGKASTSTSTTISLVKYGNNSNSGNIMNHNVKYNIGGDKYNLSDIKDGILRGKFLQL